MGQVSFFYGFDVLVSITTKTGIRNSHGVFHFKCKLFYEIDLINYIEESNSLHYMGSCTQTMHFMK